MGRDRREAFDAADLREHRYEGGRLTAVRFTYGGREIEARLDAARREWRVRSAGRLVGVIDALDGEAALAVAEAIVSAYLRA